MIKYKMLMGDDIIPFIEKVIPLRAAFFAEYPYLQDPNDVEYQRKVVSDNLTAPGTIMMVAEDGDKLVGITLYCLFNNHIKTNEIEGKFRKFLHQSKTAAEDFIFGIWTLTDPEYRKSGVTSQLGDMINQYIVDNGFKGKIIPVITRPTFDPKAPEGFSQPINFFTKVRGYRRIPVHPNIASWTDIGDEEPTNKVFEYLVEWVKPKEPIKKTRKKKS